MKSYARILVTGCILALAASAIAQTPPKPVPVHHTDAEWNAIAAELSDEVQTEHNKFLKVTLDFNDYKLDQLSSERREVVGAIEATAPGSHWDERSHKLIPAQPPTAPSPAAPATVPAPTATPTPTAPAGKASTK